MAHKHQTLLCDKLHNFRVEERYTDFSIISMEGDQFPCHRVVMAAASPFFDTLFGTAMKETSAGSVKLPFRSEIIQLILAYIYTSKTIINMAETDTIPEVYHAANYIQLVTLVDECEQAFKKGVPETIALDIWHVSKLIGNSEVTEITKGIALQNFSSLCTVEQMSSCTNEILREILSDRFLNCSGTLKCKAVWCWLIAQEQVDQSVVEQLMASLIKSENVDNEDIRNTSGTETNELSENLDSDEICHLQTLWDSACKKLIWDTGASTISRNYEYDECLLVTGGDPRKENQITVFNFKKKVWNKLEAPELQLGYRYAICAVGSLLFLSGGTRLKKQFHCFDGTRMQWVQCMNMPEDREQHVMCSIGQTIYVLAGKSSTGEKLKDVAKYSLENETWTKSGEIACPITAASSAQIGMKIYLLGGSVSNDHIAPSDQLQCYDAETNMSWNIRQALPFCAKRQTMSAVAVGDEIYVVYKGDVYAIKTTAKIASDIKVEKVGSLQKAPMKGFAVTEFGGKIFVMGGEDAGYKIVEHMTQFDTETKQSVMLPLRTPGQLKDFAHARMSISRLWNMSEL